MTEVERFLDTVERFIAERGITPTQFGREYASDPLFVFDLRKGREPRSATREKVLAAIRATPTPEKGRAA